MSNGGQRIGLGVVHPERRHVLDDDTGWLDGAFEAGGDGLLDKGIAKSSDLEPRSSDVGPVAAPGAGGRSVAAGHRDDSGQPQCRCQAAAGHELLAHTCPSWCNRPATCNTRQQRRDSSTLVRRSMRLIVLCGRVRVGIRETRQRERDRAHASRTRGETTRGDASMTWGRNGFAQRSIAV